MDQRWNYFFYVWMLGTSSGGPAFNYWLASALKRRASARNGITAVVVGLLVQWGLGLSAHLWIIRTYDVPEANQEAVGYFVYPFVLAFISFPAALFVFYRPSFSRKVSAASGK